MSVSKHGQEKMKDNAANDTAETGTEAKTDCCCGNCGTSCAHTQPAAGESSCAGGGGEGEAGQSAETEKTVQDRIAELEAEKNDLQDKYLRKSADLENYRKRMVKEKQEIFDYANAGLLTDLIGILDDFDRALAAGTDAQGKPLADLQPVVDGIQMINKQMRSMLETKYDLTVYGEKGDVFDHDKHEAIATSKGAVAESVCSEVYLKGYMLKDRVIRHAKVMVTTPDGTQEAERNSDGSADN